MGRCKASNCNILAIFNVEGSKTGMFCSEHAEDHMVDVLNKRCKHESCTRQPIFNVEGSKTGIFCSEHAEDHMVDILHKRCKHSDGCSKRPLWGYWADGEAKFCAVHKDDLNEGPAINYSRRCKVAGVKGCGGTVRWGPAGEHPTHCHKHGAPKAAADGFVCVPVRGRRGLSSIGSSSGRTARARRTAAAAAADDDDDGGQGIRPVKKARKARPRKVGTSDEESEEEEYEGEDDDDDDDGDDGGDVEFKAGGELPQKKILWL
ncbi:unnamed protein product [Pylaiella littoralis]